jgi:hypothetical protein
MSREAVLENVRRFRTIASLYRQTAGFRPDQSWSLLGQAKDWECRALTITLASDLVDESDSFQDFVVAHELLHLRVPNHGRLFKALMTVHVPGWRRLDARARSSRTGGQ